MPVATPIDITDMKGSFKSERSFCDVIEANIERFVSDAFDVDYKSHKREFLVCRQYFGKTKSPKIDFCIDDTNGNRYFVEVKHPKQAYSEGLSAITQLLAYDLYAEDKPTKLVMVSSYFHPVVIELISKYELPIMLVLITNELLATWDIDFYNKVKAGEMQVHHYAISE